MRTRVGIVGAGPAGLTLARLLERQGIETVVLESRSREYCEARIRAGVLEHPSATVLRDAGVGARMDRLGILHGGIYLQFEGERHHVPMDQLVGQGIVIYGQNELVKDLIKARIESGLPLHFDSPVTEIDPLQGIIRHGRGELRCDLIAGCDGFHGVCRTAIPESRLRTYHREYPFGWLGVLAQVAPSTEELVYANHERGFALLSLRSPQLSRYYLQVAHDEDIANWADTRIWEELRIRTATDGWVLEDGPVLEKGILGMRSFVAEPMQYERLFLAGDAAHIVPPTGAKGLNLAINDARILAEAIFDDKLEDYSRRCLRRVWRAEHFSWWMTSMFHAVPGDDAFGRQLQLSQLQYVTTSAAAARGLAENYTGLVEVDG